MTAAVGCGGEFTFGTAVVDNVETEFVLYATEGTALGFPNAYALLQGGAALLFGNPQNRTIRTDITNDFDYVFDIDASGDPVLVPTALLGFQIFSSYRRATTNFEAIDRAPLDDYVTRETAVLSVGDVFIWRSRPMSCLGITLFTYAKVEVLEIDTTARTVRFRLLYNPTCGFRGLLPGIPTN